MSQTCPNCGQPVAAGHRFCSSCGHAMSPPAQAAATTPESAPVTYVVQRYDGETAPPAEVSTGGAADAYPEERFVPLSGAASPSIAPMPGAVPPPAPSKMAYGVAPTASGSSSYGNFTPPPSARQEGGAYAPYVSGTALPLEKASSQRSWLTPVLLAGVAVLLLLALGAGYLLLNNKSNTIATTTTPSSSAIQSTLPANASDEDKVKEVVRISNEEQIRAWKNLDPEILKGTRTGPVLDENIQMVEKLKAGKMYAVPVNERLDFVDVKVNGDSATVRTIETWTVTFYSQEGNTIISKNGPDTLNETYSMVKQNGKWLVKDLKIDNDPNAKPTTPPAN